ncbi:DUF6346 domain-containing protein [Actinophytocola gossypii]|uniref:DUF3592 domain-containing protein n=1 Tax=Actinophytocola gossypii TaxID=2812003 RepID=A0ABT2J2M2_9PSEU|nr:DUF6346 domain-containing protein [Actinophytocola gossypii]MCT2581544.1 hypothetical protein [Actinophytocola gossypii]
MRALAFGLVAVVGFLLLATVIRTTDVLVGSPDASRMGSATATSCTEYGPVGRWGIGYSHDCAADVRWDDGTIERVDFAAGQLEPGETDVAVFESDREPGRDDSARWFLAGPVLAIGLGLVTLWFTLLAVATVVTSVVPAKPGRRREREDRWPVTKEEVAATPVTPRVRRLRLLAWLGLAAGGVEVLASLPYFDAPRRVGGFVSPWPELESAWLVDPPSGVIAGFGALLAALIGLVARSVHEDGARIVRYGQDYVDSKRRDLSGGTSWIPTAIMVALLGWAVVQAVVAVPGGAPAAVWAAALRDAVILLGVLVVTLVTRQSARDMVDQLLPKSTEPRIY